MKLKTASRMREDPTLAWSARTRDRGGRSDATTYLARLEIHIVCEYAHNGIILSNDTHFLIEKMKILLDPLIDEAILYGRALRKEIRFAFQTLQTSAWKLCVKVYISFPIVYRKRSFIFIRKKQKILTSSEKHENTKIEFSNRFSLE